MKLTKENRTEFVINMTKHSLWYVINRCPGNADYKSIRRILTAETPIYRLTILWDGKNHPANPIFHDPVWEMNIHHLYELYVGMPNDFEERAYAILEPLVLGRIDVDLKAWPWTPCGYCTYKLPADNIFGAFAFEVVKTPPNNSEMIAIHIGNNKIPRSPFEDIDNLRNELSLLLKYVSEIHFGVKRIGCSSWLNNFDRFVGLFPTEWILPDAKPNPVAYGYNWWGQFVSRTGGFNFRNAELMRKTGSFPFQSLSGACWIESLRKHLR